MSEKDLEPYYQSGVAGVEHRDIGAAGSDHPFGDEPKPFEADLRPLIRQVADDLYDSWELTVREYLANAETACLKVKRHVENPEDSPFDDMIADESYEPAVEVTWDKSEQKLTIQDNGIGMAAVEVDQVFRYIGRSAARDLGTMSGAFGMGALSFSKFIGEDNMMVMMSHSRLNDDNASYLVTLAGVEPIRGSLGKDEYGTKFTLDQKKQDMEIRQAVERYAEMMRVPVLYRELDEDGKEIFNEDWGDKRLYDDYEPGKYADEFVKPGAFEAYMSPSSTNRTLLLSMEIDRGNDSTFNAPYPFDVRILDESGKVVECNCQDADHEDKIPVARMEYEQMLLDARPDHITEPLLSNQDVTAYKTPHTDADYVVEPEKLESDEPLPAGEYATTNEIHPQDLSQESVTVVIMGPHSGRRVVSEDKWNELPEGRAAQFVPEGELSDSDLCLPEPTTDRSTLQSNDEFWKYIANHFAKEYDEAIEEWRRKLQESDDEMKAMQEMDSRTVADLKGGR